MNASLPNRPVCPKCGRALDVYAPEGECPRCMLVAAAGSSSPSEPLRFGDYELFEEIGRGGMGVVHKARQLSLGRIVAIKLLPFNATSNPESVKRFRAEASAAAALRHPNIVAIHEVGVHQGQHHFAMDLIEGQSLARIVAGGPLSAKRAARYLKTIAEAIEYAHQRGILHRDLKPSNVLLDAFDQPHVTDFGLARRLEGDSSLTLSGQLVGSPSYMPPEQTGTTGGKVSRRSDVYALGAMLYHLVSGRPPFVGDTVAATLQQVQSDEPVSPRLLNPSVPRDLATICLKCLEKEPAKRYPTAQALADELGRYLNREPILARAVSRPEKAWRWCRRKPALAALILCLLVVFAVGLAGILWQWRRAETSAINERREHVIAEGRLYASEMSQAFRAWDGGNLRTARALLDAQRPETGTADWRGTEWRWLWSLCQSEAKPMVSIPGDLMMATGEPSPDGRRVATAHWSSTNITIYDLSGAHEPQTLAGHSRIILGLSPLAWSPDGRCLLSASGGFLQPRGPCEFFLWDLTNASYTNLAGHSNWLYAVAWSPNGRWLASACQDGTVGLWDAQARTNLAFLRGHHGPAHAAVFSADSHWLFTGGHDGTVRRWDVATRREVGPSLEHEASVCYVAVSPNSNTIATTCTDQYVRLWDVTSRRVRKLPYLKAELPRAPVFSSDGRLLAFGTGNNIRIWDLRQEEEKTVLRGSLGEIVILRFLPDGRRLISSSDLDRPLLWDVDRPEKLITLRGLREGVCSMTLSGDQPWLVVGTGDHYFEAERAGEAVVIDLTSQQPVLPPLIHPQAVNSVSVTTDGKLLATGCADGHVRLFALPGGQWLRTLTNAVGNQPRNVAFSPHGRMLVSSRASPGQLTVWNTATWEATVLLREPAIETQGLVFSPDGSLLVTPMGSCAVVWNLPSGTTNTVLPMEHRTSGAAFSADGKLLAIHAYWDIVLFEVNTWKRLDTLKGHESVIAAIAFAPEGKTLASVGFDNSLRLWSVPARAEVAALYDHVDYALVVAFTPDGRWLITGSRDKTVKLRRIPTFEEIQAAERPEAARR